MSWPCLLIANCRISYTLLFSNMNGYDTENSYTLNVTVLTNVLNWLPLTQH